MTETKKENIMQKTSHVHNEESITQQFFASLDRREKTSNWFLAIYIIAILLLTIVGGIVLLS